MKLLLRMLSFLLVAALLLPCFAITGTAAIDDDEEDEEEDPEADFPVLFNRTFDESNTSLSANANVVAKDVHTIELAQEQTGTDVFGMPIYNQYVRMLTTTDPDKMIDGYFEPKFKTSATDLVVEISLRKEAGVDYPAGSICWVYYDAANTRSWLDMATLSNNAVYSYATEAKLADLTEDKWTKLAFVFDIEAQTVTISVDGVVVEDAVSYPFSTGFGRAENVRIRMHNPVANAGRGMAFDDLRVYEGTHVRDLGGEGAGAEGVPAAFRKALVMKVNVPYALVKRVQTPISEDGTVTPVKQGDTVYLPLVFVAESFGYEVGTLSDTTFVLMDGEDRSIVSIGSMHGYINGATVSFDSEASVINVNNQPMVDFSVVEALLPDQYISYDDMGVIVIGPEENMIDRDARLSELVALMEAFIFENPTGADIYTDALEYSGGTLSHPRLLATADEFDAARAAYEAGVAAEAAGESTEGMYVYLWTRSLVNSVLSKVDTITDPVYGYDSGGRQNDFASNLVNWAFATQMIRNTDPESVTRIADRALKYIYALAQFDDWNPGHELNCSETAKSLALVYDWMYDVWAGDWTVERVAGILGEEIASSAFVEKEDGTLDVKRFIEDTIYYYGIGSAIGAYNFTKYQGNPYHTANGRGGWTNGTNNWNAVCNGSYLIACLALMDVDRPITENTIPTMVNRFFDGNRIEGSANYGKIEYSGNNDIAVGEPLPEMSFSNALCSDPANAGTLTYASEIRLLMGKIMQSIKIGVRCYAPDGSYGEGPGYWAYGTNHVFMMAEVLSSVTGKTYGLLNIGGLDTTGFFAMMIENSDGKYWNYHDSGNGSSDTSHLGWVGQQMGDYALAALRYQSVIDGKKGAGYMDILYFDPDILEGDYDLPLDALFDGIDTAVFRSSWDAGAVFTGLHGGLNSFSHSDIDAGNFIYQSHGIQWFLDYTSENYNVPGYWSTGNSGQRWTYYRKSSEGHNTVFVSNANIPYGQIPSATADMTDFYSNEYGGYAMVDLSTVLGGSEKVTSARRGLLFTNSRKTVVVQDELHFSSAMDVYWAAQINGGTNTSYSVELAEGSTVAYLTYTKGDTQYTVRATIVPMSPTYSYFFRVMDTSALLAATVGVSDPNAPQQEYSRAGYSRLVIESKNTTYFACAVVIETIENRNLETGYTYESFDNWMPVADTRPEPEPENPGTENPDDPGTTPPDPGAGITMGTVVSHLRTFASASGAEREKAMLMVAHTIRYITEAQVSSIAQSNKESYDAYVAEYDAYRQKAESVNGLISEMFAAGGSLTAQAGGCAGNAAATAGTN